MKCFAKYLVGFVSVILVACLPRSMAKAQTGNEWYCSLYQQKNVSLDKEKPSDRVVENKFYIASGMEAVSVETISGQVTDNSTGETLPGVNILVKSTSTGASTDSDGNYELTVESLQDTLVFSFVGYKTQQVPISGRTEIDVALQSQAITGEEMVVVGYGKQEKKNLTESVSKIDGEKVSGRPNGNLSKNLQGTIAGLNIQNTGGESDSETRINIRGFTSINGGEPLVLIDGVQGDIDNVNPEDVKSVTVLKDASASAIYGARAAFGVVLVTTKKAQPGQIQVSYNNSFSWETPTRNTDYLTNSYKSTMLVDQAFQRTTGNSYTGYTEADYEELKKRQENPSLPDVVTDVRNGKKQYIYYANTDWWDTLYRKWQPSQKHSISISGGSDRINAYASGRFYEKTGILEVQNDPYESYNARGKLNFEATDWLTLSDNLYVDSKDQTRHGGSFYGWQDPWGGHLHGTSLVEGTVWLHGLPAYSPTNPDGTPVFRTELNNYTVTDGVWSQLYYGKTKQNIHKKTFSNTIRANITPLSGLEINADYTTKWNFNEMTQRSAKSPWSIYPGQIDYLGANRLVENRGNDTYYALNFYGQYEHSLGNHNFKEMIGTNRESKSFGSISASKRDIISDDLNALDLGISDPVASGEGREWSIQGYFFRLNYNYNNRYLLEVNGRYDGTSRFPEEDRWGFFPSISAGWLVSSEPFFDGAEDIINLLKLRASYGTLGNQQVATYAYTPTLSKETANYLVNGKRLEYVNAPGLNPRSITWEKVKTGNIGLDLSLFDSKLTTSVDLFQRETVGMLTKGKTLPSVLGAASPKENAADLRTRGFELEISYNNTFNLDGKPLHLEFTGNLSNQSTIITKFDNPNKFLGDYYVDQEIGEVWGYHVPSLFNSDQEAKNHANQQRVMGKIYSSPGEWGKPRAGDVKFADLNNDGIISRGDNTLSNPGDRHIIGNAAPKFPYSFSVGANWNNIDFSVFFQGIAKQDWYPNEESSLFWGMYNRPYVSFARKDLVKNRWTPKKHDGYFPRLRGYVALGGNQELSTVNDRYLQSISYLRLKNITIGYSLPQKWIQSIGLQNFRLHVSGENLLTFSPLTDYVDPEAASNAFNFNQAEEAYTSNGQRATGHAYPFGKIYTVGINIDF